MVDPLPRVLFQFETRHSGGLIARSDQLIEVVGMEPVWPLFAFGSVIDLSLEVISFAEAYAVMLDVTAVWHLISIRDVVGVYRSFPTSRDLTSMIVPGKDSVSEGLTDELFLACHRYNPEDTLRL